MQIASVSMNSRTVKLKKKPNSVKIKASAIPNSFTESHVSSNLVFGVFFGQINLARMFFGFVFLLTTGFKVLKKQDYSFWAIIQGTCLQSIDILLHIEEMGD